MEPSVDWLSLQEEGERHLEGFESWIRQHRAHLLVLTAVCLLGACAVFYPVLAARVAATRPCVTAVARDPQRKTSSGGTAGKAPAAARKKSVSDRSLSEADPGEEVPNGSARSQTGCRDAARMTPLSTDDGADGAAAACVVPHPTPTRAAPREPSFVWVHVAGAVKRPGVVRLPGGARAWQAVKAAGGLAIGADLDHVNLARRLPDEAMLVVPVRREARPDDDASDDSDEDANGLSPPPDGKPTRIKSRVASPATGRDGSPRLTGRVKFGGLSTAAPLDLNSASAEDLACLPGIGSTMARLIVEDRRRRGPFSSVRDLTRVPRVGPRLLRQVEPYVTVAGPEG